MDVDKVKAKVEIKVPKTQAPIRWDEDMGNMSVLQFQVDKEVKPKLQSKEIFITSDTQDEIDKRRDKSEQLRQANLKKKK